MSHCPNCGMPLQPENQKFCPNCGAQLPAAQDAAASTATTQAAADPSQVASALLGAVGKALVTSLAPTILTQATKFKEWTDAEN